jgi:ferredoxin--NADP+ reductase
MGQDGLLLPEQIEQLRFVNYNATVESIDRSHPDLMRLRVRPDGERIKFEAGQYTTLGLGAWERRVPNTQAEQLNELSLQKMIRRAYSISCRILDDHDQLVNLRDEDSLEFFIALIHKTDARRPTLTPRLFELAVGDRLYIGRKAVGHYTLATVHPDDHIVMVATGTGEAPHNAMLIELLTRGHRGRVTLVTCVRRRVDLAYLNNHRQTEEIFNNYRYLTLTTREPENLDKTLPNYVGKRYLQQYFESGEFEHDCETKLQLGSTHIFLCGNPSMIGAPCHAPDADLHQQQTGGMIEVLEKRGFRIDRPNECGDIHIEKYW